MNRRKFFAASTASAAAGGASALAQEAKHAILLKKGDVILFQGDSITDAGRDRKTQGQANNGRMLGRGYPHHIAGDLLEQHRDLDLKIYNRGISGNKVPDLDKRWEDDCLKLKPAV
ncbi:MAG: lipolytic protein G-D-S-L family, partial [Verrucomicrobiota bacterium]